MSKTKNATIAAVFALGVSAAMITPASAVGTATATYNCNTPWATGPYPATFTRTAPTTPAGKNLTLVLSLPINYMYPSPVGDAVATLSGPTGTGYPLTLTNPNVIPATSTPIVADFRVTGSSPATLTGPSSSFTFFIPALRDSHVHRRERGRLAHLIGTRPIQRPRLPRRQGRGGGCSSGSTA